MKDIECAKRNRKDFGIKVAEDSFRQGDLQCEKWDKGEKEHGSDWPGILGLIGAMREEVADMANYLLMLEHTIENHLNNQTKNVHIKK